MKIFRKFWSELMAAGCAFPCLACGHGEGQDKNLFCPECLDKLDMIKPPLCPGCGGELDGVLELCSKCIEFERRPWEGALAVFSLHGAGEQLVHRFKFNNSPELARPFAAMAAELLREANYPVEMIIPVPLHWSRCFMRGYNQSALFCEELAKLVEIPCRQVMRRAKHTRQQARLSRDERRKNLQGAFEMRRGAKIEGRTVLLVDDVITTGATLSAAALALKSAGAAAVYILVIGRR